MIRTVYIAAVLGVMTFFGALALGVAWGLVIEKDGPAILASSFISVAAGLTIGAMGFGLGLLFFRTKKEKVELDVLEEAEDFVREDGRERARTVAR